ncbi:MAG: hypothetical protein J6W09_11290 [Bacteroidales bacterium]|nr:hypothetical protein [Bacteroidales bacterium]
MKKIETVMAFLAIFTIIALAASVKLGYTRAGDYKVEKVERIWNIGAKENGFYSGDCYYMVYTDCGVFKIELTGINAYAYGAGLIKAGKTYVLKTRGARIEMWGLYPNIINAEEYGD